MGLREQIGKALSGSPDLWEELHPDDKAQFLDDADAALEVVEKWLREKHNVRAEHDGFGHWRYSPTGPTFVGICTTCRTLLAAELSAARKERT
jgi:hypothetical protein